MAEKLPCCLPMDALSPAPVGSRARDVALRKLGPRSSGSVEKSPPTSTQGVWVWSTQRRALNSSPCGREASGKKGPARQTSKTRASGGFGAKRILPPGRVTEKKNARGNNLATRVRTQNA